MVGGAVTGNIESKDHGQNSVLCHLPPFFLPLTFCITILKCHITLLNCHKAMLNHVRHLLAAYESENICARRGGMSANSCE